MFAGTSFLANTRRWINASLMLGQHRKRWTNIQPALVQRLVHAGLCVSGVVDMLAAGPPSKHEALNQCWINFGPLSTTLAQHQTNIGLIPRVCWAVHLQLSSCLLHVGNDPPVWPDSARWNSIAYVTVTLDLLGQHTGELNPLGAKRNYNRFYFVLLAGITIL